MFLFGVHRLSYNEFAIRCVLRRQCAKRRASITITYTSHYTHPLLSTATTSSTFDSTKYIDIGANLLDTKFLGEYNGSTKHPSDIDTVLSRSLAGYPKSDGSLNYNAVCERIIITSGTFEECKASIELCKKINAKTGLQSTSTTAGFHPTRSAEYIDSIDLLNFIKDNTEYLTAFGELGLDYDRLQFADKEAQHLSLNKQLDVIKQLKEEFGIRKPLFIHNRNCGDDLYAILKTFKESNSGDLSGVVHSFDDSIELATKYLDLGLYIGLNGCSFRTEDNLSVIKEIPLERILLETDSPWCDLRQTHAGFKYVQTKFESVKEKKWKEGCYVKNRMEPSLIGQVAECLAGVKGEEVEVVRRVCGENTMNLFFS